MEERFSASTSLSDFDFLSPAFSSIIYNSDIEPHFDISWSESGSFSGDESNESRYAAGLLSLFKSRGVMFASAESCTGGSLCGLLTDFSGSSSIVWGGAVTYSNEAKQDMLGVPSAELEKYGAVSAPVAISMASGMTRRMLSAGAPAGSIAVSVTGIAGPGGGSEEKPVGLVYTAVSGGHAIEWRFSGDRSAIRSQTRKAALLHAAWKCLNA